MTMGGLSIEERYYELLEMDKLKNPTPKQIATARHKAGLTQTEAAALIYCTLRAWQGWEGGQRRMHPAFWELWKSKASPNSARADDE